MKSKLRHPIRAIREPFGTAGLIIACIALVAALGGSAIAAKGALTGKQKKEVEKIAKKFAGKPGAPGAAGPAGPQGAPGAKGDTGVKGDTGAKGDTGSAGPQGPKGDKGEPWTAGGTLPPGETETGTYTIGSGVVFAETIENTSISYNLPLTAPPNINVIRVKEDGPEAQEVQGGNESSTANCPGSFDEPKADPGNLCLYQTPAFDNPSSPITTVLSTIEPFVNANSGTVLNVNLQKGVFFGTWAVTAPTP